MPHQVIFTVTDLTKVVHGVRTVVLWDRDFYTGQPTEAELAFHAQDNAGNPWNLGEYPAQYSGGKFTEAPDTWISGLPTEKGQPPAQGGTILPGNPQEGTPIFLQAYAAPDIILDCGQVSKTGQHVCNSIGCYDNVVVIDETSPPDPGSQQKYYAPGVGNFQVGATNDPQGETLVLSETLHLSRDECIAAREAALALEDQAYHHDTSQTVYKQTSPMEQTGLCETIQPVETPSATPITPTMIPTTETSPTATPTTTPPAAPNLNIYIPIVSRIFPTPTTLPTPTLPPAIFDGCRDTPNPASAPNSPVRIVKVDKVAEVVTLQNVSNATVSLEDWNMCSIGTHQEHDQIFGTIAPGQTRNFPNTGDGAIWNDTTRNDGALYNPAGFLVSYWVDQ